MRKKLTAGFVANPVMPTKGDRAIFWDTEQRGLALLVTSSGHRSWCIQYRNAAHESRRMTPKSPGFLSLSEARKWARAELAKVAHDRDPLAERKRAAGTNKNSLRAICEEYFAREGSKLRTIDDRRAALARLVYPLLGGYQIDKIKRSQLVNLLDGIEDECGARMATLVLAYVRRIMSWHATRDDDFVSPVIRGMARGTTTRRDRTLSDDELRSVWRATDGVDVAAGATATFARMAQFILLTATRRGEAAAMTRDEIDGELWIIPSARMKAKQEHVVPLSAKARGVLSTLPDMGRFVFTVNGKAPIGNFERPRAEIEKLSGTREWTLHDLRRTSRTLLSRAGVDADIAERCLAHNNHRCAGRV
jgi:integrase